MLQCSMVDILKTRYGHARGSKSKEALLELAD
jgi:hypothetical protein